MNTRSRAQLQSTGDRRLLLTKNLDYFIYTYTYEIIYNICIIYVYMQMCIRLSKIFDS